MCRSFGFVGDGVERAVRRVLIEALHFGTIEGTCAATAKDGELVAGFVDGAVSIDALGNGECWAARACSGDELWRRAWAETGEVRGIVPRRNDLEDAQAVVAVRDKCKDAARDHTHLDVIYLVHLVVGIEDLVQTRG